MTFFALATEDELSESLGTKLIEELGPDFSIWLKLRKGGFGYLRSKLPRFIEMAARNPILIITDLDRTICPSELISNWFSNQPPPPKMVFRVAVHESESWLMADHHAMKKLLGRGAHALPRNPDEIRDPKQKLLECARSASREVRRDLIADERALASQGLGYNMRLCKFVRELWCPQRAASRSRSLSRTRTRLRQVADMC